MFSIGKRSASPAPPDPNKEIQKLRTELEAALAMSSQLSSMLETNALEYERKLAAARNVTNRSPASLQVRSIVATQCGLVTL